MSSITENGVIYLLTSPSGKQYVGQSWNYEKRLRVYRCGASKEQIALHAAIVEYGWDNITAVKIARGIETQEALDAAEDAFIMLLNTLAPNGYNLKRGGAHGKHHDETRKKIGDANRGKSPSLEARVKMSAAHRGRKHSPETRNKISESLRGKTKSPETRAKLRASHLGNKHSPETCAKMSASRRGEKNHMFGKSHSVETRKKIGDVHRGKTVSPETRRKMSAAKRGKSPWNKGKRKAGATTASLL